MEYYKGNTVIIQRAYKTKLNPNNVQRSYFYGCAGVARFVYNWALADRIERYKQGLTTNKFEQKKRFNALKHEEYPWLREYPYVIVQYAFDDLDLAYQNFFRRVKAGTEKSGFPKFKSRHKATPKFCVGQGIRVERNRVKLPKIGWVRLADPDYIPTSEVKINRATISERAGEWYVSVQVEMVVPDVEPPTNEPIGIDVGIKAVATCSDGTTFDNPKTLAKYEARLARLQRELNRRAKGSKNRDKTKQKIARLHRKIADTRKHTLHDASRHVTANTRPVAVVIEDLNVKGMMANRKLSKALADASMSELHRQIEYKAAWNGIEVVKADRWYPSSKTCSQCGHIKADLTLSDRVYICDHCGYTTDRDMNAAQNLAALYRPEEPVMHGELPVELACSSASL